MSNEGKGNEQEEIYYSITGKAAYGRLTPLLPSHWIDKSPYSQSHPSSPSSSSSSSSSYNNDNCNDNGGYALDFIWENAPRHETKARRDHVKCYSHLPNGIGILDDKWNLARLFMTKENSKSNESHGADRDDDGGDDESFVRLETHCFRGISGLECFYQRVGIEMDAGQSQNINVKGSKESDGNNTSQTLDILPDLVPGYESIQAIKPKNLWVIKDANSNGYGGIWIMDEQNAHTFLGSNGNNRSVIDVDVDGDDDTRNTYTPTSPLHEEHRYVAQEYAWPPVLYRGRKCHIRVYAVIMNGCAYVHRRCFLHVANERFEMTPTNDDGNFHRHGHGHGRANAKGGEFDPAVHITNCCANSHDADKFAGEICADFESDADIIESDENYPIVSLKEFYPSVAASVKALAERSAPYVQGGEQNGGFEYLGLDFILSYKKSKKRPSGTDITTQTQAQQPVAYLLEVNCPPSQDTATGLDHAEDLHNEVLRDLVQLWVIPHVNGSHTKGYIPKETFGWNCVYKETPNVKDENKIDDESNLMVPSKATILNKIKWGMFERRAKRAYHTENDVPHHSKTSTTISIAQSASNSDQIPPNVDEIVSFTRKQFPYFGKEDTGEAKLSSSMDDCITNQGNSCKSSSPPIFFENAGGSQVPSQVIRHMVHSLSHRHRSLIGAKSKEDARSILMTILGGNVEQHRMYLGANATSLFASLAQVYLSSGFLSQDDDIIIASENHSSNVKPWQMIASFVGAHVCWWTRRHVTEEQRSLCKEENMGIDDSSILSKDLDKLLTQKTRIVCLSHVSNVLGSIRDIRALCQKIRRRCPRAQIIVDGVAAAPHLYANVSNLGVDWYVISCHKLFGPHIGAMCGLKSAVEGISPSQITQDLFESNGDYKLLEVGTVNYEGCSGIRGLGNYFSALGGTLLSDQPDIAMARNNDHHGTKMSNAGEDTVQSQKQSDRRMEISSDLVIEAYRRISMVEDECLIYILQQLRSCPHIRLIREEDHPFTTKTLPVVSFIHERISATTIVQWCFQNNVIIRCGSFLSTELMQTEFEIYDHCRGDKEGGVVRISVSHYNDISDAQEVIRVLQAMEDWI